MAVSWGSIPSRPRALGLARTTKAPTWLPQSAPTSEGIVGATACSWRSPLLASFVSDGRHRSTFIHLFAPLQGPFRGVLPWRSDCHLQDVGADGIRSEERRVGKGGRCGWWG